MPDITPSADQDCERLATRRVVYKALNHLSEKTRLAVTLFYTNGYSCAEIAGLLEISVNAVRRRLRHAKRQLYEEMMDMVIDVFREGKLDSKFARQVMEKAMRRSEEARLSTR